MIKNQQGFSFVEVLVAVVVLGLIIGGFSGVFSSSIGSILAAGDRYRALTEAQHMLERALAVSDLNGLEGIEWNKTEQLVDEAMVHGRLITVTVPAGRHGVVKLSAFKAD
ncbi:prepilin-type N-terminal cleavage/methylation domain-containing protein [Candidatus Darwinibacter acetoxidans]